MKKQIVYDDDADGILSAGLFKQIELNDEEVIEENRKVIGEELYIFDKGFDIVYKLIENNKDHIKKIYLFDHHTGYETDLFKNDLNLVAHIELNSPSTFNIVSKLYRNHNRERFIDFIKNYKDLVRYTILVENEYFHKLRSKDIRLYFKFFDLVRELKDLPLEEKIRKINEFYHNYKDDYLPIIKESYSALEKLDKEVIENKLILYNYDEEPLLRNAPFFLKNSEYFLVENLFDRIFRVSYRLYDKKTFEKIINTYRGGGRKSTRDRFLGVFYIEDISDLYKLLKH
jgi:hypothetical protein